MPGSVASTASEPAASGRQFHALTITDVRRETRRAVSIAFAVPEHLAELFRFAPGQYLTLRSVVDGEEVRRTYSVCTGLDEGELRVAVKRLPGGRFSTFAHELLTVGSTVEVMPPRGRFTVCLDPSKGRTLAAFASGSGITPIMSIMKSVLAREPGSRFFLFFGNRSAEDILFKEEIEDLKDRYLDRLAVFHVLSRQSQELEILNGRLDGRRIRLLLTHLLPAALVDEFFLCGPEGMLQGAQTALHDLGVEPARVRIERFTPATPPAEPAARPALLEPEAPHRPGARVALVIDGTRHSLALEAGETIIDAGLRAGLDLPYSCRAGMCCTCRAKLLEGEVLMKENFGLEPWEVKAGYVLTCQSLPQTASITVDYDQV